jgi:hypothetical protein
MLDSLKMNERSNVSLHGVCLLRHLLLHQPLVMDFAAIGRYPG